VLLSALEQRKYDLASIQGNLKELCSQLEQLCFGMSLAVAQVDDDGGDDDGIVLVLGGYDKSTNAAIVKEVALMFKVLTRINHTFSSHIPSLFTSYSRLNTLSTQRLSNSSLKVLTPLCCFFFMPILILISLSIITIFLYEKRYRLLQTIADIVMVCLREEVFLASGLESALLSLLSEITKEWNHHEKSSNDSNNNGGLTPPMLVYHEMICDLVVRYHLGCASLSSYHQLNFSRVYATLAVVPSAGLTVSSQTSVDIWRTWVSNYSKKRLGRFFS